MEVMKSGRVELDPEVHTALSVQAAKRGITLKAYVHELLLPAVEITTWEFMGVNPEVKNASGEPVAKSIKPKVNKADLPKPRLADNPEALEEVARLAAAGHSIRDIAGTVDYPRSTVEGAIRRLKAAGEISEGMEEGEESTSRA